MYIQKKMQEISMKKPFFLAALTAVAIFTACSESGSSSNPAQVSPQTTPAIGDTTTQQPVTQDPTDPAVQNPVQVDPGTPIPVDPVINDSVPPTVETTGCAEGEVPVPVIYPQDEFVNISDVYKATQCNEKVVFFIRHGERENGIGKESPLTEDGALDTQAMGATLIGPEKFAYVHSGFVRTYQTVLNIAIGRGEAQMLPDSTVLNFEADTITELADGWYLKDRDLREFYVDRDSIRNVNVMYTKWVYDDEYSDVFYDLAQRSEELIHTHLVKDYAQMPKFTVVASHDQVVMPLTAYVTDKKIDIILHRDHHNWLNFLAGVAIIINDKNEIHYAAVKGLRTGTF